MKKTLLGLVPVVLMIVMAGCAPAVVKDREIVQISFTGTLPDGKEFGHSEKDKPLEFLVGSGRLIPALEKAMLGMKTGDKKKIEVKAADAYGEYDKNALQTVPRAQFPKDLELKVGQAYSVNTPQGPITVTISAMTDTLVTVDFNHPLAGKDLTFDVQVVKIRPATKDELAKAFPDEAAPAPTAPAQPAQK
jgi:FKBP-type peptidyl-prolyl cis-trans isomerase 2